MERSLSATVYLDLALDKPLDYLIPLPLTSLIKPGSRVLIPVKNKNCVGTVIMVQSKSHAVPLKAIEALFPEEDSIPEDLLQFGLWVSQYYCTPFFKVLRLLLPPPIRRRMAEKKQLFVTSLYSRPQLAKICADARVSEARVLEVLLHSPKGMLVTDLLEKSQASRGTVNKLVTKKVLSLTSKVIDRSLLEEYEFFTARAKVLNEEQQKALQKISYSLNSSYFETHLLHGITGSGKTEVYLRAIEVALTLRKSTLFLVPEISLISQAFDRLKSRFSEKVALLHHRLNEGQRRDTWKKIHEGAFSLVLGARSALFSPIRRLGLIIVDEEHDAAYKQEDDPPCYHARDAAVMRGKLTHSTVILGSATPALESYANALSKKYTLSTLSHRADTAQLPTVTLVDMKFEYEKQKRYTLFSDLLLRGIEKRLEIGEQSLLFLNRRGFHTLAICQNCEYSIKCHHCSIHLTFHKKKNILSCHLCNKSYPMVKNCSSCQLENSIILRGSGTEQVEQALYAIFPKIRILRWDADTARYRGAPELLFKQFRTGKADLLIGTQMIAKGFHFPSVTLVGILDTDASLQIPDFRSTEQSFQLITQVAGRSGRSYLKGEVILQTRLPSHSLFAHTTQFDYLSFFQEEMKVRGLFQFPPFCYLIKLLFTGKIEQATLQYAQQVRKELQKIFPSDYHFYPVVACNHLKIKDRFRFQCLIKGKKRAAIAELLKKIKKDPTVSTLIDIDPLSIT